MNGNASLQEDVKKRVIVLFLLEVTLEVSKMQWQKKQGDSRQ